MNRSMTECASLREQMTEWTLKGRSSAGLPDAVKTHLDRCPACALYAEGLHALPVAVEGAPLYTPALRARTLARLAGRPRRSAVLWLVPGAMALNLAASLLLPAFLFLPLFQPFASQRWLALGASALAAYTIGTAAAGLTLAALRFQTSKEEIHA